MGDWSRITDEWDININLQYQYSQMPTTIIDELKSPTTPLPQLFLYLYKRV